MYMLHGQTYLHKPVQDLLFREEPSSAFLDATVQVSCKQGGRRSGGAKHMARDQPGRSVGIISQGECHHNGPLPPPKGSVTPFAAYSMTMHKRPACSKLSMYWTMLGWRNPDSTLTSLNASFFCGGSQVRIFCEGVVAHWFGTHCRLDPRNRRGQIHSPLCDSCPRY